MNRRILFLFGFIFAAGQEMIAIYISYCIIFFSVFVEMQLLYISGPWATAVCLWDIQKWQICGVLLYMQISRDSSNYTAVLCMCFQITVCPHRVRKSPLQKHSMISKWVCISEKCIYVYLCIFIYLCAGINRWPYVCVFGLNQNEYKIKQFYELLSIEIMSCFSLHCARNTKQLFLYRKRSFVFALSNVWMIIWLAGHLKCLITCFINRSCIVKLWIVDA